jgi:hypothetical protein
VADALARHTTGEVGETEWQALLAETGLSESALRRALRELQVPVDQPFAGVRQQSLEDLETTLLELERVYTSTADPQRKRYCRRLVIDAKDHARLAARHPQHRARKEEMVQWMLVWLENPAVFPAWVTLRKRALTSTPTPLL